MKNVSSQKRLRVRALSTNNKSADKIVGVSGGCKLLPPPRLEHTSATDTAVMAPTALSVSLYPAFEEAKM